MTKLWAELVSLQKKVKAVNFFGMKLKINYDVHPAFTCFWRLNEFEMKFFVNIGGRSYNQNVPEKTLRFGLSLELEKSEIILQLSGK